MFDPSIFDNLKVAVENQVYDLDNLDGAVRVTGRDDRMEMSVMSREFAIRFVRTGNEAVTAEIGLTASLADLAAELLKQKGTKPGCAVRIRFYMEVGPQGEECSAIQRLLEQLWPEQPVSQTLCWRYGDEARRLSNTAEIRFVRKIDEDQMEDLPGLLEHVVRTLDELPSLLGYTEDK
ncbi:hypothetical protein [Paenibacillus sp. XY044]|uniref:hypothetical protein n=1 Tax=Paenibacillus sp. XY044 TaxID=2026089 RepID=UPI000B987820|nr:hypothetical protein [Paenibacillus sp. XY044]OZB90900.1 hypothetical protein CJP46_31300 [Paenibacillus sp. XY044]